MKEMTKGSFELPLDLRIKFKQVAAGENRPMGEIVRELIEWYVEPLAPAPIKGKSSLLPHPATGAVSV